MVSFPNISHKFYAFTSKYLYHLPCILHLLPQDSTEDHLDVLDEGVMPIVKQFSLSYPRLQLSVARQIIVIRESPDHKSPDHIP